MAFFNQKASIQQPNKPFIKWAAILLLCVFSFAGLTTAHASSLPNADLEFEVHAFDIVFGKSKQTLRCHQNNCQLTAIARPSGLASWFVSESTREVIQFRQTKQQLTWLSYRKEAGDDLDDTDDLKTVTLKRDANNQVTYPEKNKQWPQQPNLFDMVSISYALAFRRLNQQSLTGLVIQDTYGQDPITIQANNKKQTLELADFKTEVNTQILQFETKVAKVKIWQMPQYDYLPARVDVYNKEKDKTITLLLTQLPKLK